MTICENCVAGTRICLAKSRYLVINDCLNKTFSDRTNSINAFIYIIDSWIQCVNDRWDILVLCISFILIKARYRVTGLEEGRTEENDCNILFSYTSLLFPKADLKKFEPRLKFKPRLKYGWFHLKLYSIFQDLSRRSIETGFWQI